MLFSFIFALLGCHAAPTATDGPESKSAPTELPETLAKGPEALPIPPLEKNLYNQFFTRQGQNFTVATYDESFRDDRFVLSPVRPRVYTLKSFTKPDMYVCQEWQYSGKSWGWWEKVLLSSLPEEDPSSCHWIIETGSAHNTYRITYIEGESIHHDNGTFGLANNLYTLFSVRQARRSSNSQGVEIVEQKQQLTNYLLFSKKAVNSDSDTASFRLSELRLYDRNGKLVPVNKPMIESSYPYAMFPSLIFDNRADTVYPEQLFDHYYHDRAEVSNQWIRIPFHDKTFTGLSKIEIINDDSAEYYENIVGVEISLFVKGKLQWSTTVANAFSSATVFVPNGGKYPEGIHLNDPVTGTKYRIASNKLRRYASEVDYLRMGNPKYFDIVDSKIASLRRGNDIKVLPPSSPLVMIISKAGPLARSDDFNAIKIAEIKIYSGSSPVVPRSAFAHTTARSSSPRHLYDGNTETSYESQRGLFFEAENDQSVTLQLSKSVKDVSRVVFFGNWFNAETEIVVIIGMRIFRTKLLKGASRGSFTVYVSMNGAYPDGLITKEAVRRRLYRISQGKRQFISDKIWEESGNPPFGTVVDSAILNLPLGDPITKPFPPTEDFLFFHQRDILITEIDVIGSDNKELALKLSDIFWDNGVYESVLFNGKTDLGLLMNENPLYVRLSSYKSSQVRKLVIHAKNSKGTKLQKMYPLVLKVYYNKVIYEMRLPLHDWSKASSITVDISDIRSNPATSSGIARSYTQVLDAIFPKARNETIEKTRIAQCPQACDQKVGCRAFAVSKFQNDTCVLYFDALSNPVPSTEFKTHVALSEVPNVQKLDMWSSKVPIRAHFDLPPSNSLDFESFSSSCDVPSKYFGSHQRNGRCYLLGSEYLNRIPRDNISMIAPMKNCHDKTPSHQIVDGECIKIIYSAPPAHSGKRPVLLKHIAVLDPIEILDREKANMLVRFVSGNFLLLNVEGEYVFKIEEGTCKACENQLRFEAVMKPGRYICFRNNAIVLLPIDNNSCEWIVQQHSIHRVTIMLANRQATELNIYLKSNSIDGSMKADISKNKTVVSGFRPWITKMAPPEKAYSPAIPYEFESGTVLKTIHEPVSECFKRCDETLGCKGYRILQKDEGCDLMADVGAPTKKPASSPMVKLLPFIEKLSTVLPYQIEMACLLGNPVTTGSGMGIHIHIIDSGITPIRGEKGFYDDFRIPRDAQWTDESDHADAIATILRRGIVPGASIHNLKIFDKNGKTTSTAFVHAVLDILQRATNNFQSPRVVRPTIISVSAVFPQNFAVDCIIESAYNMGAYIVAAAGNQGKSIDDWGEFSPGASRHAIVAGYYDEEFKITKSNHGRYVDIYAAGSGFNSTKGKNKKLEGSSLAAPQVAGVMAKFLEENPEYQYIEPIYTYRAIVSAGLEGLLKDVSPTTNNVVLTGRAPSYFRRWGDWVNKDPNFNKRFPYPTRTCTLTEAVNFADKEVATGDLVASAISPSSPPFNWISYFLSYYDIDNSL